MDMQCSNENGRYEKQSRFFSNVTLNALSSGILFSLSILHEAKILFCNWLEILHGCGCIGLRHIPFRDLNTTLNH